MKACIFVIDVQNDFFQKGRLKKQKTRLINNINDLTNFGRFKNINIIWICQEFKEDLSDTFKTYKKKKISVTIENTFGSEILSELNICSNDFKIIKKRYSGFYNTSLETLLSKLNIDTIIVAGINTHACVRTTVIDAYQRDYEVIIAKDCIDSYDIEHHNITIKYLHGYISTLLTNEKIVEYIY